MAIDTSALTTITATSEAEAQAGAGGPRHRGRWRFGVLPTLALGWLVLLTFCTVFASWLPFVKSYSAGSVLDSEIGPGSAHWLGTDSNGRDVFSRSVYGARLSLAIAGSALVLGLAVGGSLGLVAGYFRRRLDGILSGVFDVMLAFPPLLLAIAIVTFAGQTTSVIGLSTRIVAALAIVSIAPLARLVRANTLVFAQREFVLAAKGLGASDRRILLRDVLPNVVPPVMSFALTVLAILVVAEAALAFVGLSVGLSFPTWGFMINEGRNFLEDQWWISLGPALFLFLTVYSLNILGDALTARFNVRETIS